MISRAQIEIMLRPLLQAIAKVETDIISIQSITAKKIFDNSFVGREAFLNEARTQLQRVVAKQGVVAGRELVNSYTAIIDKDLGKQMTLYNQAYNAGIVNTAPQITQTVRTLADLELNRELLFLKSTLDRVASYGGNQLAGFVEAASQKALSGIPIYVISREAAADIAEEGIAITYGSGRQVQDLTAYVRMQMQTAIGKNAADLQMELYDSIDAEDKWYETSSHYGARPEHAEWQGRIFKDYDDFIFQTGFGEVDGLAGVNCRHTWYPFLPGISEQRFKPYEEQENQEQYEAQQEQRYIERNIRSWKRREAADEGLGIEDSIASNKVKGWQSRMHEHIEDTGLTRQYAREQI